MFFFSVLVVVPWILGPHGADSAFSMCQSLDLEVARARRIQAIRGQILSKLQLETLPKEEGAPHPLPPEVMLLFNSTREPVRQLATCEGQCPALRQDEEYYAKEVRRVDMLSLGHADSKRGVGVFLQSGGGTDHWQREEKWGASCKEERERLERWGSGTDGVEMNPREPPQPGAVYQMRGQTRGKEEQLLT